MNDWHKKFTDDLRKFLEKKQMSENEKYIVANVTCNTYVKSYDNGALMETKNIFEAKDYKNFRKANHVAHGLTDEDCVYKVI